MAIRGLGATVLNALDQKRIGWTILVELQFADGTVRVWPGPRNAILSYLGESWVGTGDYGSVERLTETEGLDDNRIKATLRLSDANIDSLELADHEGRKAIFYLVIFDTADDSILGHISDTREMGAAWAAPKLVEQDGRRITMLDLSMEFISECALLKRTHVRRLTHEDTLEMDPNDNFNEFASDPDLSRADGQQRIRTTSDGGVREEIRNWRRDEY